MAAEHIAVAISIVSLIVAVAGFGVAVLSASYARRQARAAEAQLERKDPVFELTVEESTRADGWSVGHFTARNSECIRMDWIAIDFKDRRVKVLSEADAFGLRDNGYGSFTAVLDSLPTHKAGRRLNVGGRLRANKNNGGPISVFNVPFVFHGPLKAKDVKHVWKWADE